jgi:hypothetical protein
VLIKNNGAQIARDKFLESGETQFAVASADVGVENPPSSFSPPPQFNSITIEYRDVLASTGRAV